MFNISVIYDNYEDCMVPLWMLINSEGGINWHEDALYIPINLPFQRISRYEVDEYSLNLSIVQTELIISHDHPECIGIYLPRVKARIDKLRGNGITPSFLLSDIQNFIIQVSDIEMILQMNTSAIFAWR